MNRIKIVHITQSVGGVKRYINNILENFDSSKFEHVLISPDYEFNASSKAQGLVKNAYTIKMVRQPSIGDLTVLFKIVSILRQEKPNLIHSHSAKGGVLGRVASFLLKTPCIFTPNGFSYLSFTGKKRWIFKHIEKAFKVFTSRLLAVGVSEANLAVEELNFPNNRVEFVSNAVKVEGRTKTSYKLKGVIGTVGRLTHQKNPLEFIELASSINQGRQEKIKFIILGSGFHDHLRVEVQEAIQDRGLSEIVEILPWDDGISIYDFYDRLDLFVMTSIFEGLPFSLLESMSFGLPCIVSNTPGTKDPIRSNCDGFVYSSFDELHEVTNSLLNDQQLREKIGKEARNSIVKNYNVASQVKSIERNYLEVIRNHGSYSPKS